MSRRVTQVHCYTSGSKLTFRSGSLADVAGRIVALERSQSGVLDLAKQMRSTVQQWGKDAAQADVS